MSVCKGHIYVMAAEAQYEYLFVLEVKDNDGSLQPEAANVKVPPIKAAPEGLSITVNLTMEDHHQVTGQMVARAFEELGWVAVRPPYRPKGYIDR